MDNLENILKECLENHYQMIKQFRGTVMTPHCITILEYSVLDVAQF